MSNPLLDDSLRFYLEMLDQSDAATHFGLPPLLLSEEELNRLKRKVGELTMDLDILREAAKRPTTPGTSDE